MKEDTPKTGPSRVLTNSFRHRLYSNKSHFESKISKVAKPRFNTININEFQDSKIRLKHVVSTTQLRRVDDDEIQEKIEVDSEYRSSQGSPDKDRGKHNVIHRQSSIESETIQSYFEETTYKHNHS